MFSSSVALKVTVEANFDIVVEGAIEAFGATFVVKSAGTLFRRLDAIQAYEDWCAQRLVKHRLPVSEFDVWIDVTWLRKTHAPATKSGSLVEVWGSVGICLVPLVQTQLSQLLDVTGVSFQTRATK